MLNLISKIIKNWKIVVGIVVLLCFGFIGFMVAWKIQNIRYEKLKIEFTECQKSLNSCIDANKDNVITIEKLKSEITRSNRNCENRINEYKKLLKKYQEIDNLTGGQVNGTYTTDKCNDDVCNMLNSMFK